MTVATTMSGTTDDTVATTATTTENNNKLVGGEPRLLEAAVEIKGVQDILAALSQQEFAQLSDANMPLRHFRAEKGNTPQAIAKLKDTLKWRQEFGVDKIKNCFSQGGDAEMRAIISKENETAKIYIRGYDKEGRANMYMYPARENTHNELNNMRHLVFNLEKAIACTLKKSGLEKINLIIDYNGFKIRDSPPLSTSRYTLDILQKHYPERMKASWLCKPPVAFKIFWTIIKPFVDPTTREKIVLCHGAAGQKKIQAKFDLAEMEPCAYGPSPKKDITSKEYLALPFDKAFDEDGETNKKE